MVWQISGILKLIMADGRPFLFWSKFLNLGLHLHFVIEEPHTSNLN